MGFKSKSAGAQNGELKSCDKMVFSKWLEVREGTL